MILDLKSNSKEDSIKEIAQNFYDHGYVNSKEEFENVLIAREDQGSTALGDGVAIAHSKNKTVKEPAVLFAKKRDGLDYQALDGEDTFVFFAIAAPDGENKVHVDTLAELSKMIMKAGFVDDLKNINSAEDVYGVIDKYSDNKIEENTNIEKTYTSETNSNPISDDSKDFIVSVTACPNGIAHTYRP
ncbi:PTS sugar transporter subunit IIA [Anaerococcus sp. Marseille-Q5996]|uniref:PTS sugar transporter subunit IIA n=1 Tax=Anaerococcus sp. Marseille-Q5996 TaxID=2972769 RepID=UPI0021C88A4D|nr:fructose PTS transporter subunit IIA [Anaerococcus sp. Marseille-Q5996]